MNSKMIAVEGVLAESRRNPAYIEAYETLDEEFALASNMICARTSAQISQEEISAEVMKIHLMARLFDRA